jgi:hypothetical protein
MNASATRKVVALGAAMLLLGALAGCASNGKTRHPTSSSSSATTSGAVTPAQAREIAKEAYIYGFPMVDGYRIQYSYFVDQRNPNYKGLWNQIHNIGGCPRRPTRP